MDPDAQKLEKEYNRWRAARRERAVREFQEMLDENSFVEFWGRFGKMAKQGDLDESESLEGSKDATTGSLGEVKFDEGLEEDEGEGGGSVELCE